MTELKNFQLRLIKRQSAAFNFERATVALLARYKAHIPVPAKRLAGVASHI